MSVWWILLLIFVVAMRSTRYRPTLSLEYVEKELKLEGKEGAEFIAKCGLAFVKGKKSTIDTKNSDIVWVLSNQSSLI
jgi:hypothetical protein